MSGIGIIRPPLTESNRHNTVCIMIVMFVFFIPSQSAEEISYPRILNGILPPDIRVRAWAPVPVYVFPLFENFNMNLWFCEM
jgi:hypothetical protein